MFRLGVIEESLENKQVLDKLAPFFFSQRIENVPEDIEPIWHTNEYHVPDEQIGLLLDFLSDKVKLTWYIHAFSDNQLYVVLKGKVFKLSPKKDSTWNEMIEYGVEKADVERRFLEKIPLHV